MKKNADQSTTIQRVIKHLDKQKEVLEKELEQALLTEDKAYRCKQCGTVVEQTAASPAAQQEQLCSSCLHQKWIDKRATEIEHLQSGVVTDITTDGCDRTLIREIKIFRNNRIYRIGAYGEQDYDARMELIDSEPAQEKPPVDVQLKPGQKQRKERPLIDAGGNQ